MVCVVGRQEALINGLYGQSPGVPASGSKKKALAGQRLTVGRVVSGLGWLPAGLDRSLPPPSGAGGGVVWLCSALLSSALLCSALLRCPLIS